MKKGFTTVELMIIMAIVVALVAIAIPNLLRVRLSGYESAAITSLQDIAAGQAQYREGHTTYADLNTLIAGAHIDSSFTGGQKQGYIFALPLSNSTHFYATARCSTNNAHSFYIDETGIACRSNSVPGTAVMGHKAAGNDCPADYAQVK